MGLFNSIKEAGKKVYESEKAKAKNLKEARGSKLKSIAVEYAGGYGDFKKSKGFLTFYEKRVEYSSPLNYSFIIQSDDIRNIAVEGIHEVNRRVTVTRLLAVGIFAFAVKKKQVEKEAFITLEINDGQEAVFKADNKSPHQLKGELANTISAIRSNGQKGQASTSTGTSSYADELLKFAELNRQGIISDEELEKAKRRLLG